MTSGEPRRRLVHDRFTSSDPKDGFDTDGQAGPGADGADCREHTWHEGHAVQRIMPDGQGLALRTEEHLLMGNQSAESDTMDPDPVNLGTSGTSQLLGRGIGRRSEGGRVTRSGDPACSVRCGAGWRIGLSGVMQLDDLRALIEGSRLLRESIITQLRGKWGDQDADPS